MLTFEIPHTYNAYPYIETKYFINRFYVTDFSAWQ